METLTVQPYDFIEHDFETDPKRKREKVVYNDQNRLAIHIWALDRNSAPYLLRVPDFPVFCLIELPVRIGARKISWSVPLANIFMEKVNFLLRENQAYAFKFFRYSKLYYYQETLSPMIRVYFHTLGQMRALTWLLNSKPIYVNSIGEVRGKVLEAEVSTTLKLLTHRNVSYSQWISLVGERVEDVALKISSCANEYIIDWRTIEAVPVEECQMWRTFPRIVSWDIECYSQNHRRMPQKTAATDICYMISVIYQRYLQPETRRRYCILIGDCHDISPEEMEATELIRIDPLDDFAESTMVQEFANLINRLDPEILVGYNVHGFDFPYLDKRLKLENTAWPNLTRIINGTPVLKENSFDSRAYGKNNDVKVQIEGRISLDALPAVKREHKLDKYTLDHVCAHFIRKTKHDVKAVEMFAIYEESVRTSKLRRQVEATPDQFTCQETEEIKRADERAKVEMTRIVRYCIQDSELVIELIEKLSLWTGLLEMSKIVHVNIGDVYSRGQQIRCDNQLYDLATKNDIVLDKRTAPDYPFSGGFVGDPVPGLYENVICLDFASLYPSEIIALNLCYTTLIPPEQNHLYPDESNDDVWVIEFDQEEEEGAKFREADFEGDEEEGVKEEDDVLAEIGKKKKKVTLVTRHYKFKFSRKKQGLLPLLVKNLIDERTKVREQMKGEKSPIMKEILNQRQLALKVTANSFFGFLGVQDFGRRPMIEIAMVITAKGRQLINDVNRYCKEKYGGSVVYNDTDSSMVSLPQIKRREDCEYWGLRLAHEISGVKKGDRKPPIDGKDAGVYEEDAKGLFPPPLRMEYEKGMRILCFKKKKYVAMLIKGADFKRVDVLDDQGNVVGKGDYELMTKGIVLARRDNAAVLRKIYTQILRMIMTEGKLADAVDLLIAYIEDVYAGKIPVKEFTTIRQLGANYKSPSYFMKVFHDYLKKVGKIVNPGDRLEFLIVKAPAATLLGEKMRLIEQYEEAKTFNEEMEIDYEYYISKALLNPINQLIAVGFKPQIERLKFHIGWKGEKDRKVRRLDQIMDLILKLKETGYPLSRFPTFVRQKCDQLDQGTLPDPIRYEYISREEAEEIFRQHEKRESDREKARQARARKIAREKALLLPKTATET